MLVGAMFDELKSRRTDEVATLRAREMALGVVLLQLLVGTEELLMRCQGIDYIRGVVHTADKTVDMIFATVRQQGLGTVLHFSTYTTFLSIT